MSGNSANETPYIYGFEINSLKLLLIYCNIFNNCFNVNHDPKLAIVVS